MLRTAYEFVRDSAGFLRKPVLEVTGTRAVSPAGFDDPVKSAMYQIKVENRGKTTAHDVKGRIFFYGTRNVDSRTEEGAEITVDSQTCWARADNPSTISLHAGESGWLNVFRLIEDYRAGANFDNDEDRHIEFPSGNGWEEPAEIQFRHANLGAASTDPQMNRKAVHQTEWKDVFVELVSEETSLRHEVGLSDINTRMGTSILFTEDSFSDWSEKFEIE